MSPEGKDRDILEPDRFDRREILSSLAPSATDGSGHWIRVHRPAMACLFEVTLGSEEARHVKQARAALDQVDALEASLTVFRDTSELHRVNQEAASGPVQVSKGLQSLLLLCRGLHEATEGAFDPTSTPLSRRWGFLAREGRQPDEKEIEAARAQVGMERVELDEDASTVRFTSPGVELNLGSIGKGWALDRIAASLHESGVRRALVNAGGSSFLGWGRDHWLVALRPGDEPLATLRLHRAALGTSGAGRQHFEIEGRRYGHVIDPRTGWPAGDVRSATVISDDAARADALATALLVGGGALARTVCGRNPGTVALLVHDDEPRTIVVHGSRKGVGLDPEPGVRLAADDG